MGGRGREDVTSPGAGGAAALWLRPSRWAVLGVLAGRNRGTRETMECEIRPWRPQDCAHVLRMIRVMGVGWEGGAQGRGPDPDGYP